MDNKIVLDRTLEIEELVYWNNLLDIIPVNQNTYISGRYGAWNFHLKENSDQSNLRKNHILYSQESETLDELKSKLQKDPDTIPIMNHLNKALDSYQKLFPDFNPFQLMIFTIYSSPIIDSNISISNKEILLKGIKNKNSSDVTYAPQISLILDLMAGKMKEINPNHPFESLGAKGSVKISLGDKNIETIAVCEGKKDNTITENRPTFLVLKEKNYIMEYAIDFSGVNSDYKNDILSPFDKEQINITKELHRFNLNNELKTSGTKVKKNKI